ncbi:MAG: polyprenyl synthetase family protein [Solirubrobacterales bacterium]|nr:polyprenyl synthetase family protein [Solirubrobacterales bacterium]
MSAAAVQTVVDFGGEEILHLLERAERRMSQLAAGHGQLLAGYAGQTIAAGGKRLRPLLVFLAAGAPPPQTDGLLGAAVAVELVHAATLIHDDVLDGSPLRRGHPTVFAAGGRRMAIATGDLLFSRAFAELAATGSVGSVRVLAGTSRELAAGEVMQRADAFASELTVERYLERCRLKTAVLFQAACELGALESGGPASQLAAFGEEIGLAFQILDDVLDVTGPPERTGKPRGADLLDGTVTLPLIVARRRDPEIAALDLREITTPGEAAQLCDRISGTEALEDARSHALGLVRRAKHQLPQLPHRQRAALELVADGVVERYT